VQSACSSACQIRAWEVSERGLPNLAVFGQGGACGAAGPASAPGSAFPEARPAYAGPHRAHGTQINSAHSASRPVPHGCPHRRFIVPLSAAASRALLPVRLHGD
jgi:hypothetical protein